MKINVRRAIIICNDGILSALSFSTGLQEELICVCVCVCVCVGGGFGLKHFKNLSRIDGINLFSVAIWAVNLLSEIKEEDSLDANFFPRFDLMETN
jgi:hypothetical protein